MPTEFRTNELSPAIYEDWMQHLRNGYIEKNDLVIEIIRRDHRLTVRMYVTLFIVGVGFFVAAAIIAVTDDDAMVKVAALFGGLGVVAFLRYFITRSVQSIEENMEFVTWLSVIYNTYWTRLAWVTDVDASQEVLKEATEITLQQMEHLIDRHALARGQRPGLRNGEGDNVD